jgi:hypothetical protein
VHYNDTSGREITIDVLRGYFILSMASGHLAEGVITSLLHVWVWVDGAAGFVCLSGFVLGLSQHAKWRRGDEAAQWWILLRAAQIWLVSIAITLFAVSARAFFPDLAFIENIFTAARLPSAVRDLLLLDLNVPNMGILSMYVAFLFCAFFAVAALKRNLDVVVLGASFAVYLVVQFTADRGAPEPGERSFWRTAWQFLFFAGLVAGWRWREGILPAVRTRQTPILVASALAMFALLVLAHSSKVPYLADLELDLWPYFHKFTLSPGVVIYFAIMLAFLATALQRVRHLLPQPVLHLVAMFGRHSLACFVLLCLLQVVSWVVATPDTPEDARHIAWFGGAVVVFTLYCFAVERFTPRTSRVAHPAAPGPRAAHSVPAPK